MSVDGFFFGVCSWESRASNEHMMNFAIPGSGVVAMWCGEGKIADVYHEN
jgi:hypothetical protein